MAQVFHYSHPETPAGPGFDTVIADAVAIDPEHKFVAAAALGDSPAVGINVDDPQAAYDFVGLNRWYVIENECPSDDHYAYNGYVGNQRIGRAGGGAIFPIGAGRSWDLTIAELSSLAGFRAIVDDDGERPAEPLDARLTWLISGVVLPVTDNGLIDYNETDLDANDYRGQFASDVLNDMALKIGYLWWIYYDQSAGDGSEVSLAFFHPDSPLYQSPVAISNVPPVDSVTVFAPDDANSYLDRDPQKIAAGVYLPYTGGSVYVYDYDTADEFAFRDQIAPTASVKTEDKATALASRFLADNDEQDERAHIRLTLPAAQLNDIKHGQRIPVTMQHWPGWEGGRNARIVRKTFGPPENRGQLVYDVDLEVSPSKVGSCSTSLAGIEFEKATGTNTSPTVTITPSDPRAVILLTFAATIAGDTPTDHALTTPSGFTLLDEFNSATGTSPEIPTGIAGSMPFVIAYRSLPTHAGAYSANSTYVNGFGASEWLAGLLTLYTEETGPVQHKMTTKSITSQVDAELDTLPIDGNILIAIVRAVSASAIAATQSGWTLLSTTHTTQPGGGSDPPRNMQTSVYARCFTTGDGQGGDGKVWRFTSDGGTYGVRVSLSEWAIT